MTGIQSSIKKKAVAAATSTPAPSAAETTERERDSRLREALQAVKERNFKGWDLGAARTLLEEIGHSAWAHGHREETGHFPRHKHSGWPVDCLNGTPITLETGLRVHRSEVV